MRQEPRKHVRGLDVIVDGLSEGWGLVGAMLREKCVGCDSICSYRMFVMYNSIFAVLKSVEVLRSCDGGLRHPISDYRSAPPPDCSPATQLPNLPTLAWRSPYPILDCALSSA